MISVSMSFEREMGQLTEAVSGLKTGFSDVRSDIAELGRKFDRHLEMQAKSDMSMNYRIGRLAGTVALVASVLVSGVKEALAKMIHGS